MNINLANSAGLSPSTSCGASTGVSVSVDDDTSSYNSSSWQAQLTWSLDNTVFYAFESAVVLSSGTKARRNVDVRGARFVRLEVTTAESGADPEATVNIHLSNHAQ